MPTNGNRRPSRAAEAATETYSQGKPSWSPSDHVTRGMYLTEAEREAIISAVLTSKPSISDKALAEIVMEFEARAEQAHRTFVILRAFVEGRVALSVDAEDTATVVIR